MDHLRTLDDLEVGGRTVLVRADLNVPMEGLTLLDGLRIERLKPTVTELLSRGARVVLISHYGRPGGSFRVDLSLRRVNGVLGEALQRPPLPFAEDCIGPEAARVVAALEPGEVALLENLRFHPGETANDPEFAAALAALGNIYVNDAFSCAHRAHASVEAIAHLLPSAAGRAMAAELEALGKVLETPARPVAAVIGGAKVSSKLALLSHLAKRVQVLAVGGGMANTFLLAKGNGVGHSQCEPDLTDVANEILAAADAAGCEIVLPEDVVVAEKLEPGAATRTVAATAIPDTTMVFDIGPKSAEDVAARLGACRTLVWNGPLGAFETEPFDRATRTVAEAAARLTREGALVSVAGGGDTVAALAHAARDFTYISTAGGAFLEWLEGKRLPGVEVLRKR